MRHARASAEVHGDGAVCLCSLPEDSSLEPGKQGCPPIETPFLAVPSPSPSTLLLQPITAASSHFPRISPVLASNMLGSLREHHGQSESLHVR